MIFSKETMKTFSGLLVVGLIFGTLDYWLTKEQSK